MQDRMLNQNLANLDFSKIQPLHQKRTLAFVNHFVVTNVQFLNNFMKKCEQKLMQFERKLEKINAVMVLLETRLSSIPEVNTTTKEETAPSTQISDTTDSKAAVELGREEDESNKEVPAAQEPETKISRPEYDRFVKMVHVGVPLQAVKLKLSLEGLDPNVLDDILGK